MMLLPWIGTRDDVELIGYLIERCPSCGMVGVFALYDAKKRLTIFLIPTQPYKQLQLLECKSCHARFGVPADQREALAKRIMSQDELSERIKQLGGGGNGATAGTGVPAAPVGPSRRTLYQVLQVDPAADPEVIEAAFKRLALKYHPDRSAAPDAAERMRELIAARETLTDARRRQVYDASLGIVRRAPPERPRPPAMRPEEV
jgi:hypothetical protein